MDLIPTANGGNIVIWFGFCESGSGTLVVIDSTMNTASYQRAL